MNTTTIHRIAGRLALAIGLVLGSPVAPAADATPACPPTAQPPSPEQVQAGLRNARDRGFLWRISKDGRSSYLYGTVHVAKVDWMYPGATVMRAARESERIAVELDMLDADIAKRLVAAAGVGRDATLPAVLAARLRAQAMRACLPLQSLAMLSPEMQVITLSVMAGRVDGLDPSYAIDPFFAGLGRGMNKPVVSLETPESQMALMRAENEAERISVVDKTLAELENDRARAMIRRIADAWAQGRLDELQRYEQWCDCANTDEERRALHRLLDERNPVLAEGIAAIHEGGHTVFAAVGSLHMIGAQGLPALFKQRGYTVERIEFASPSR
jgi:uncharacterized protein